MERLARSIVFVVVAAALGTGCRDAPRARIVRMVRERNTLQWNLSVNGGRVLQLSSYDVTNKLSRLGLGHGDVALLGTPPGGELWDWIKAYCDSNQVAVYLYGASAKSPGADMFSLSVYHWTAPFDDPRTLAQASFFREGEFLGEGSEGFQKLLTQILRTRPRKICILGGLYDRNRSYGPFERPYENQQARLDSVLRQSGTELVLLEPMP